MAQQSIITRVEVLNPSEILDDVWWGHKGEQHVYVSSNLIIVGDNLADVFRSWAEQVDNANKTNL